ncbi:hypothetical protein, conserved [Eimeria brunetti]|uniref:Uncharacterized protein n=1 Tax=Eimeria brunetti TaxID=51314 RepID=U6LJA1_9EIME|nr:hypothetical protein, conserved [Eimeria brunetti]
MSARGEAEDCIHATASAARATKHQEENNKNRQYTLTQAKWSENYLCGDLAVEEGKGVCVARNSSGAQGNADRFDSDSATAEHSQNHVSQAEDDFAYHEGQRDPECVAPLPGASGGASETTVDQQRQPQEKAPMFGEAAVHAVLTAREFRRKQQNAERESQLSKIRINYAKERKSVEETVINRLLQESRTGMAMQISEEQRPLKTNAAIVTGDATPGINATEVNYQVHFGSTTNPNTAGEGPMEESLDFPRRLITTCQENEDTVAMTTQDESKRDMLYMEEHGFSVHQDTTAVANGTVNDVVVSEQQLQVSPFTFWESIESDRCSTSKGVSLSETVGVPSPDSLELSTFQGHHTAWRSVQHPTLHVLDTEVLEVMKEAITM